MVQSSVESERFPSEWACVISRSVAVYLQFTMSITSILILLIIIKSLVQRRFSIETRNSRAPTTSWKCITFIRQIQQKGKSLPTDTVLGWNRRTRSVGVYPDGGVVGEEMNDL